MTIRQKLRLHDVMLGAHLYALPRKAGGLLNRIFCSHSLLFFYSLHPKGFAKVVTLVIPRSVESFYLTQNVPGGNHVRAGFPV